MNKIKANAKFCFRSDTLENWESTNPILEEGEFAVVQTKNEIEKVKIGDGSTPFNELGWWKGEKGETAYEIAVSKGFEGTEEEWLDSFSKVDQYFIPSSSKPQSGTAVAEAISAKQDKLIAGLNIKTINGKSILGYGDLGISNPGSGSGENGATFTPNVSSDGIISWTNDKGLSNPTPVNIKGKDGYTPIKGKDYNDGDDGYSPTVAVSKSGKVTTINITDKNGKKTATINDGEDGKDGYTPVAGVDYYTEEDKAEFSQYIASELAKRGQLKPEFANSIEECTDVTKLYVLPDGFIYAYMYSESTGPSYTNLAGDVQYDKRLSSSGAISSSAMSGAAVTGFIPVKQGDVVRVKNLDIATNLSSSAFPYFCFYTGASESNVTASGEKYLVPSQNGGAFLNYADTPNGGVAQWTAFTKGNSSLSQHANASALTHIRISGKYFSDQEIVVTVNEEISEGTSGGYSWQSTGHAFVPADYEEEINKKANKTDIPTALKNPHTLTINGTKYDGSKAVEVNIKASNNILYGKKWVALGDSLTEANRRTTKNYHDYIAEDTGITVVNMGVGGTGYKRTFDSNTAFYQRILNVPTDADVVTIFGSGNDLSTTWNTYGLGEVTDTDTDTICGCINKTIDNLYSVLPTVQLGIITPTPWDAFYPSATTDPQNRMTLYSEAIIDICKMRGIPYLDLYHCSGLRPWESSFKALAYSKDDGGGTHPDETGHKIIAPRIKAFLESLII